MARQKWPIPSTREPDLAQLMEWLFGDLSEATDGCTVQHDGICPHGHPSWLLRLEFVHQPKRDQSTGT